MTRHDYDGLVALSVTRELSFSHFSQTTRNKLEDLGYATENGGYYAITAKGRKALSAVRGAPTGTPFSKGDRFELSSDAHTLAWLKQLHDQKAIKLTLLRSGKWRVEAC